MNVHKTTSLGVVTIKEWEDSQGNDDHGREGGGYRQSREGVDYRGHKPEGAKHTQYGSKTETHRHVVTSYRNNEGKTVMVDHDLKTDKAEVLGTGKKGENFKGSSAEAKQHLQGKFGINHDFQDRHARLGYNHKESFMDTQDYSVEYCRERDFDTDARKAAAKSGAALPDGSFPIQNKGDLKNAIEAIGRAKDPAAAKAHIKKRAVALGAADSIPDAWESWQALDGEIVCEATFTQGDSHAGLADKLHQAIHGAVCAGKDMDCDGDDDSSDAKQYGPQTYVRAVHDKHVIYSQGGKTFAHKYTKDEEGDPHLAGSPKEVQPAYQSKKADKAEESFQESLMDFTLAESGSVAGANELPVTIIRPGVSKNGRYYSPEMLKRDFKVFEGAKMFLNHATDKEAAARPEGDMNLWVASLKGVHAESDGTLKGMAVLIDPAFKQKVDALREAGLLNTLGVSIRAAARFTNSSIDGKPVKAIESFIRAQSVDFVTFAGAGGQAN